MSSEDQAANVDVKRHPSSKLDYLRSGSKMFSVKHMKALKKVDKNNDGKISISEVADMSIKSGRQKGHLNVLGVLFVLALAAIGLQSLVTVLVTEAYVDADKSQTDEGVDVTSINGKIVGTRIATQTIPLTLAPAMSIERLAEVKSLMVTFRTAPPDLWPPVTTLVNPGVQRSYSVVGATKVSNQEVYFRTAEWHYVHVRDGTISVMSVGPDDAIKWNEQVCSASLDCAALVVHTNEELHALEAEANRTLSSRRLEASSSTCENANFDNAYNNSDECEHKNASDDAPPACVEQVVEAFGQTAFFGNLDQTCAVLANVTPPDGYNFASLCEWDRIGGTLCPQSCSNEQRRLLEESAEEDVDEQSAEEDVDEAFEGRRLAGGGADARRGRRLHKGCVDLC